VPLRERLIARVASIELDPRVLVTKVPFVVLVIGSLGVGLALTLWLSTDSAERSYQLGNAREQNRVLTQQKESLEQQVLQAQAAPALAESARNLGMIPSRDTAHLVQDPAGNWIVVGDPAPAQGAPPPPLNTKLPDPTSAPAAVPANRIEVPVMVPSPPRPAAVLETPAPTPAPPPPMVPTGPLPGPVLAPPA
jgi:cell division protein FtsB